MVNVKLTITQLSKIIQTNRFFARLLVPLMKVGLPKMNNVLTPLTRSALIPLALTAAALVGNSRVLKKF